MESPILYKNVKDLVVVPPMESKLVQQHFRDEVDINTIVRRFGVTNSIPDFRPEGVYGDFTGIEDYDSAVERVERVHKAFDALPAEVREKFGNDVSMLIRTASVMSEDEFGELVFPVKPDGNPDVPPKVE